MTTFLTIAQVAEATGLSTHTLRYYERIGLLDSVQRRDNGHRVFRAEDMTWLEFLLRLRDTGMPIAQMQEYAALRRQGDSLESVSARQRLLELHAAALEAELRARAETLAVLRVKLVVYDGIRARIEAVENASGSASSSSKSKRQPKRQPNEDAHDTEHAHRTSRKPRQPAGRPLRTGLAKAEGSR
ncbi:MULTISPECIES: MerR family transcriptional regulator [Ralstonia]|jgi:DNA-binding transcriptional MerR regulator|uniref:MerR family transcriptional regulator n=1 Tax=Ralstonia mojiangensis TaxID=2953895 RepID=A0AAE3I1G4_9RALS|nr:MerR family transcriptional regulator [Ralstonia mojiangensis]MCO5410626.1 MerR family transcriptional regulator [Ralstonia mojiangensis]MCT7295066.1 MerR family transcriptional regulator [Ralstonia mojiangensis]MCT7313337.1 MerR family transcriptional regulator [Ralstonia mojiangensis]MCT7315913.1 MerR family transcriptional regulator [Ralstonia mojiangensis]MCT7325075.1 MerR family transcriptional regulator [Ralstonia mojiangensis]